MEQKQLELQAAEALLAKKELENQLEEMTDEINLNDEELNLPDHRFTQQAKDLANLQGNASIISTEQTEQNDITVNLELFQEKQDEIERLQDLLQKN